MEDKNKLQPDENQKDESNMKESVEQMPSETGAAENAQEQPRAEQPSSEEKKPDPKSTKKKNFWKETREWIVSIAVALLVVFFIRTFFFQIIRVDGASMNTTLADGERLFVTILDVRLKGVERNDIVICHYPNRGSTNFVKRVVAVPGDTVYREKGVTHVVYQATEADGSTVTVDEMLDEQFVLMYPMGSSDDYEAYTLDDDEYFVVGDNRYNSHDSRDWNDSDSARDVGPITEDMIVGKVRTVIWPLSEIRSVE